MAEPLSIEEVKHLFDLVVGSLNFGSGFLDSDDVILLRRVAILIGVDPAVATPETFHGQYPHEFAEHPNIDKITDPNVLAHARVRCATCGIPKHRHQQNNDYMEQLTDAQGQKG